MAFNNSFLFKHRALVALNNYGVALLKHGEYAKAKATFTDALNVTQLAVGSSAEDAASENFMVANQEVHVKVQRAHLSALLASTQSQSSDNEGSGGLKKVQGLAHVMQSTSFVHTSPDLSRLDVQKPSCFFAYRIDIDGGYQINPVDPLDVESAIILFNTGVALLCMATVSTTSELRANKLGELALRFFYNAQGLLQGRTEAFVNERHSNVEVVYGLFQVEAVVLHSLLGIAGFNGMEDYYHRLRALIETIAQLNGDIHPKMPGLAAAA